MILKNILELLRKQTTDGETDMGLILVIDGLSAYEYHWNHW